MRVRPPPSATMPSSSSLTWSTPSSSPHALLHLSMSPSVSHCGRSPGLLVPRSKPHVHPSPPQSISTACFYLTFISPSTIASELHTCAPQAKRHIAQPQPTPWLVHRLNPRRKSLITTQPQGHISTLCSQSPLDECIVNTNT
jgi:hypothetical protein